MTRKIIAMTVVIFTMMCAGVALADVEPIDLVPLPVATPEPEPNPEPIEIIKHDLQPDDVEALQRLLWSSPLRGEEQKEALVWLVMNRAYDSSGIFPSDVAGNITRREFAFLLDRKHTSYTSENWEIVVATMNRYLTMIDGHYVGKVPPRTALYLRFTGENNRQIDLLEEKGGDPVWPK